MTGDEALTFVQNALPKQLPIRGFIGTVNWVQHLIRSGKTWSFDFSTGTIDTVDEYNTGTIAVTNGDATVTGTGTTFTAAMAGRKIRINRVPYTIASFTDATNIELDATYPGSTDTGLSYSIYQDEYALASNVKSVLRMWDITNRKRLLAAPPQMQGERDFRSDVSGEARWYSLFGEDSSNDILVRFSPWPDEVERFEYWYYKHFTPITAIGGTIDIPSELDFVVKQGCLARAAGQLNLDPKGTEMASFQRLLEDAYMDDRKLTDIKIRMMRTDRGLDPLTVFPSAQTITSA